MPQGPAMWVKEGALLVVVVTVVGIEVTGDNVLKVSILPVQVTGFNCSCEHSPVGAQLCKDREGDGGKGGVRAFKSPLHGIKKANMLSVAFYFHPKFTSILLCKLNKICIITINKHNHHLHNLQCWQPVLTSTLQKICWGVLKSKA